MSKVHYFHYLHYQFNSLVVYRYLYRKRTLGLSPNIFMQALERNFNGTPEFESVCQEFLKQVNGYLNSRRRKA